MFVYFIEVGLVLIVAPWTTFWERNYFVEATPWLQMILTSHVVRGAVTGFGVISIGVAVVDAAFAILRGYFPGATPICAGSIPGD